MSASDEYTRSLRLVKSLLIVTSLQRREDDRVYQALKAYSEPLIWEPRDVLMVDDEVWHYAVEVRGYEPREVFCHPDVLQALPETSMYYRGMCALSLKAAKDYCAGIERYERVRGTKLPREKAERLAQAYNTFICSIIKNSADWTLENGRRTIVATLGITLDGAMRNKVGAIAEQRIRTLLLEWVIEKGLVVEPALTRSDIQENPPSVVRLREDVVMRYASDPDIAFSRGEGRLRELMAVVEIKGGIDPAGALERYASARKSFEHARAHSARCQNFFLSAVFTDELNRRIREDRLVEKAYDIVQLLESPEQRSDFLRELFHFTLRLT